MPSLSSELRNQLGKAIVSARRHAEMGAQNALRSLAVDYHEPFSSMTLAERSLRKKLRAHGRQLGDDRDNVRGAQSIDRLTHEVAYEHWHRVIFARFLAENHLLIHTALKVPVSLDEIKDLADETGEAPQVMASRFAQNCLPQIFRSGDPVLEVVLAPETHQVLNNLLDALPSAVFTASDSLGWTYQYWQTEKKKSINESGTKIGAAELLAVTQLFTEHYMVLFLFHNTIGAWHAGKVLAENPELAQTARNEEELRRAVRLHSQGGYDFEYLRFVRKSEEGDEEDKPSGLWRPASGNFEGWPKNAKELKILDPCCGSGHFLTEGFELLVRLRMDEEKIELEEAIRCVLAENLYGTELDPRCTQIAAFNLAMAAWKLPGKPIELPPLNIACSGLAVGSTKKEWSALAGEDDRLRAGMEQLYELFEQAPVLGSLIDPKALVDPNYFQDTEYADFSELKPLLEQALARETDNVEGTERAVAAQGMARAAELLSGEYTLAITNVPYLGRGQQGDVLKDFADEHYKDAKADLATIFVERILRWLGTTGTLAAATPQNWLFLGRYKILRSNLLGQRTWNVVGRLGPKGFQTPMWDFNVMLCVLSAGKPADTHEVCGLDVTEAKNPFDKAKLLRGENVVELEKVLGSGAVILLLQVSLLRTPDARVVFQLAGGPLLGEIARGNAGMRTGDLPSFVRCFWELSGFLDGWVPQRSTCKSTTKFGGSEHAVLWEGGRGALYQYMLAQRAEGYTSGVWKAGNQVWGRDGVLVSQISALPVSLYLGEAFDNNTSAIVPDEASHLPAIWCFCSSPAYSLAVREIDQALKVTNASLVKVPFDLEHWQKVAAEKYPNGLLEPQSDDPTQSLFHGYPAKAELPTVLQVAVGLLLGYKWPPELDTDMRLADEAREWVARCDELKSFADQDGIVCLSATRGEHSAADRLRELLSAAFGSDLSAAKERELLAVAGDGKKPAASLDVWLRDKFFEEHCKLFHHRPFIWHIWDGNKDGFHCLVNAHKLTGSEGIARRTLESITYSYLGDWIERQKTHQQVGQEGADARLVAALDLKEQLQKILAGEPPYDIFVRWKSLSEQAIGWNPDINDGVRLNIRPFMKAELRKGGKKGAGLLRWKPNIHWKKDRGKEPQSLRPVDEYPWFWTCDGEGHASARLDFSGSREFDGNRWNDLHYTHNSKQAAQNMVEGENL